MSIKRHPALADLSRHHHHALSLVLKINKADDGEAAQESLIEQIREFWEQGGQEHFREEEEVVLPAYAQFADVSHPEIVEMLLEHVGIRALADQILRSDNGADRRQALLSFAKTLEKHVRREERIIFPMIEKALPEKELQRLAPYLHEASPQCRIRPQE